MFIGEYQHTIDEKGRVAVPVKFRLDLSKGAVVTRGLDRCLFVYPMDAWEKLAGKLTQLPINFLQPNSLLQTLKRRKSLILVLFQ
jgi:MraZ protein